MVLLGGYAGSARDEIVTVTKAPAARVDPRLSSDKYALDTRAVQLTGSVPTFLIRNPGLPLTVVPMAPWHIATTPMDVGERLPVTVRFCASRLHAASKAVPSRSVASGGEVSAESPASSRSEEHTSELQSLRHLVC